jgi:hypothetical protein
MPITSINKPIDPADAITSVVTTFKQRDQWSRKIARDPRVKLSHRNVLRSLALCAHTDSGGRLVINPTYDELADACRCGRSTAIRAIAVAEEIGIVRKALHSDGRVSNAYQLLLPQSGSNGVKSSVPTVSNSDADEGPNGVKLSGSTVSNLPVATGSNSVTADTVLRQRESKQVSKQESKRTAKPPSRSADDDRLCIAANDSGSTAVDAAPNPAFGTVDDAAISEPLTPVPRAVARTEPVAAQNQPAPSNATTIGTAAANGRAAPDASPYAQVLSVYPEDRVGDEAKAYFAFARALDARGSLSVVLEDLASLMQDYGDDVPFLIDILKTIERMP